MKGCQGRCQLFSPLIWLLKKSLDMDTHIFFRKQRLNSALTPKVSTHLSKHQRLDLLWRLLIHHFETIKLRTSAFVNSANDVMALRSEIACALKNQDGWSIWGSPPISVKLTDRGWVCLIEKEELRFIRKVSSIVIYQYSYNKVAPSACLLFLWWCLFRWWLCDFLWWFRGWFVLSIGSAWISGTTGNSLGWS